MQDPKSQVDFSHLLALQRLQSIEICIKSPTKSWHKPIQANKRFHSSLGSPKYKANA